MLLKNTKKIELLHPIHFNLIWMPTPRYTEDTETNKLKNIYVYEVPPLMKVDKIALRGNR